MNDDKYTIKSGLLDVGDGHKIYYQDWGNPENGAPVFFLHGGPGGGCSDKHKLMFNPKKHRVIFHDQRGSGKSQPFASLKSNTTDDLCGDINRLADKLGIKSFSVYGGSWGSTLALVYAIKNPSSVTKLLLRGIFLGSQDHVDFIAQGGGKLHYPEVWQSYIDLVPANKRANTVSYYADRIKVPKQREEHIREWIRLEMSLMRFDNQLGSVDLSLQELDEHAVSIAELEIHYFKNNCFLPPDFVLKNATKISHLPTVIIHGRYDFVCPPAGAYALAEQLGENCTLHFVPAGHSGSDPVMFDVLKAYANAFL